MGSHFGQLISCADHNKRVREAIFRATLLNPMQPPHAGNQIAETAKG